MIRMRIMGGFPAVSNRVIGKRQCEGQHHAAVDIRLWITSVASRFRTVDKPGLVLALDHVAGGSCEGLALGVKEGEEDAVLAYLRKRELISSAYIEETVILDLADGRSVEAVAYVIDPKHEQYCQFVLEEQAQRIAGAVGGRGPNPEYLFNTADHLAELGIHDPDLTWLCGRVRELTA
jgi:glutathione-specific gamma-glutamylcyclotransferase